MNDIAKPDMNGITPEQWADDWIENAFRTSCMWDEAKDRFKDAIGCLYCAAGLKPPARERILFAPSIIEARIQFGLAAARWLDTEERCRVSGSVREKLGNTFCKEAAPLDDESPMGLKQMRLRISPRIRKVLDPLSCRIFQELLRTPIEPLLSDSRDDFSTLHANECHQYLLFGSVYPGSSGYLSFCIEVLKLPVESDVLKAWFFITRNCLLLFLHEGFCIVSEGSVAKFKP